MAGPAKSPLFYDDPWGWKAFPTTKEEVRSFTEKGELDRALQIVEEARCPEIKSELLSHIAAVLKSKGNLQGAFDIANRIEGEKRFFVLQNIVEDVAAQNLSFGLKMAAQTLDEKWRSSLLRWTADRVVKQGDLAQALKIARTTSNIQQKSETFKGVAKAARDKGDIKDALKTAQEIPDPQIRSSTLRSLAKTIAEKGDIEEALDIISTIPDEYQKEKAHFFIAKILVKRGQLDKAFQLALSIHDTGDQSSILCSIIRAYIKRGDIEEALQVGKYRPLWKEAILRKDVADLLARGDTEWAIKMITEGFFGFSDDAEKTAALLEVATALRKKGDMVGTIKIACQMQYKGARMSVLNQIVQDLLKKGDTKGALEATLLVPPPGEYISSVFDLVCALNREGDRQGVDRVKEIYPKCCA